MDWLGFGAAQGGSVPEIVDRLTCVGDIMLLAHTLKHVPCAAISVATTSRIELCCRQG